MRAKCLIALSLVASLAGCNSVPNFDLPTDTVQPNNSDEAARTYPTVKSVIHKVNCEIAEALILSEVRFVDFNNINQFPNWTASVTLTMTVLDTMGTSTSGAALAYMDPKKSANFAFGFTGSPVLTQQRTRTYTQIYTIYIKDLDLENPDIDKSITDPVEIRKSQDEERYRFVHDETYKGKPALGCGKEAPSSFNLAGDLGLKDQIFMGLNSFDYNQTQSDAPDVYKLAGDGGKQTDNFGATVQFVITMGATGVGPNWSVVTFKGPSAGLTATVANTHQLQITFNPVPLDKKTKNAPIEQKSLKVSAAHGPKPNKKEVDEEIAKKQILLDAKIRMNRLLITNEQLRNSADSGRITNQNTLLNTLLQTQTAAPR